MSECLVSPAAGMAILTKPDGTLEMFDAVSKLRYEPRSYELEFFFKASPLAVADDDVPAVLSKLSRERHLVLAFDCLLSALDSTLRKSTRVSSLAAVEEALRDNECSDHLLRHSFSAPLTHKSLDLRGSLDLAKVTNVTNSRRLLSRLKDKLPGANKVHRRINIALSAKLDAIWVERFQQQLFQSFVIGDTVLHRADVRSEEGLRHRLLSALESPDSEKTKDALSAVLPILEDLRRSEEARRATETDQEPVTALMERFKSVRHGLASGQAGESEASQHLNRVVHRLAQQLFLAGAHADDTRRWEYLLDIGLLANPKDEFAWNSKIYTRCRAGDYAGALHASSLAAAIVADRAFVDLLPIKNLLVADSRWHEAFREHFRAASQVLAARPNIDWIISSSSGDVAAMEAKIYKNAITFINEGWSAKHVLFEQESCSPSREFIVFGLPLPRVPPREVTSGSLFDALKEFAAVQSSLPRGGLSQLDVLTRLIDIRTPLQEDEKVAYTWKLETSSFYAEHARWIDAMRPHVPLVGLTLLGKLLSLMGSSRTEVAGAKE